MTTFEWISVSLLAMILLWKAGTFALRVRWAIQDEREAIQDEREAQLKARRIAKTLGVPAVTIRRDRFKVSGVDGEGD